MIGVVFVGYRFGESAGNGYGGLGKRPLSAMSVSYLVCTSVIVMANSLHVSLGL